MALNSYLRNFRLGRLLASLKMAMSQPRRPQEVTRTPIAQPHFTPRETVLIWPLKAFANDSNPSVRILMVVEDAENRLIEVEMKRPPYDKLEIFEKKLYAKIYGTEDVMQNGLIPSGVDEQATLYEMLCSEQINEIVVKGRRYRLVHDPPDVLVNVELRAKIGTILMPHLKVDDFLKVREFTWFAGEPERGNRLPPIYRDGHNQIQVFSWNKIHSGRFLELLPEHQGKTIAVVADLGVDAVAKGFMLRQPIEAATESPFIFEERQKKYCSEEAPPGQYRIVDYNVLAHIYAKPRKGKPLFFPYCSEETISDDVRYPIILKELKGYNADLFFLQEVDKKLYESYLCHFFEDLGFGSSFVEKETTRGNGTPQLMREGVVIAFNKRKFAFEKEYKTQLANYVAEETNNDVMKCLESDRILKEKLLTRNNIALVVALKELSSDKTIIAASTHLFFDPAYENIKIIQAVLCSRFIDSVRRNYEDSKTRTIFGGDLNSTPKSAVVKFFEEGRVTEDSECWKSGDARGSFETNSLKYYSLCGSPGNTNVTGGFKGCLDYVFGCQNVQSYYEMSNMGDRYFATYVQDLEQDPFDATDFVERLAWRITGTTDNIDAVHLKNKFEDEIASLQMLSEQFQSKINTVEAQVSREKQEYLTVLQAQQDRNSTVLDKLKQLDGTMQTVSTSVVHLGDQLESVHAPRARAYEALQLIKHFDEFLADQPLSSAIFTDPDQLLESAEMIQKLYSISQELAKDKFLNVQLRIAHKYEEIERLMIEEFVKAHQNGDRRKMKDVAAILSEFKGYTACLDAFVEHMQYGAFRSTDVFGDVLTLCEKTYPMLEEIFPNPQQVMAKLILNLFQGKLKDAVSMKLEDANGDSEIYLTNLYELYMKTQKLIGSLKKFTNDSEFLPMLSRSVFSSYLNMYVENERAHITEQCRSILQRFYESKGHQKKQFTGLQELKRGIQARLLTVENYGGETFLSEEVAINILQEFKNAFMRCAAMVGKKDAPKFTDKLFDLMLKYLYKEHVEYAIELALSSIQLSESKSEPPAYFFPVVQQTAAITHLFVKQFDDSIMPLVEGTAVEKSCVSKRDSTLQQMESLMDSGIERQLNSLLSYVRYILQNDQKRSDFKPEIPTSHISCTPACSTVVRFVARQVDLIRDSVDGENLGCILNEFGDRLYNVILVQIRSFTYNTTGALLLMYDINEYRKCVEKWGMMPAIKKFDALKSLTNLLIVEPNNLAEAASSLSDIDRAMVNSFIQLRGDYKSVKPYIPFF